MTTATAGVVGRKARELTRDLSFNSLTHGFNVAGVENFDASLQEAHEGTHTHTASEQHVDTPFGEVVDRGEAAAMFVSARRNDLRFNDLIVVININ